MSDERGKPVMLTNGERRLLVKLCEREIEDLDVRLSAFTGVQRGPAREEYRVLNLRRHQYRRLILELSRSVPSPAPPSETGREPVQSG